MPTAELTQKGDKKWQEEENCPDVNQGNFIKEVLRPTKKT